MKFLIILCLLRPFLSLSQGEDGLAVYDYYIIHESNEPKNGFVVLSDGFPYDKYKEENIIAPENLGEFEYSNDNYHKLTGLYRKRFLAELKIKESDTLFINNLSLNRITKLKVSDLALKAFLTPYGPGIHIENWDYLVGFEIDSVKMPFSTPITYSQTIFSCTGNVNPFNEGKAKSMEWEKVDPSEFKWELTDTETPKHMLPVKFKAVYLFKWGKMNFYVQEIQAGEYMFGYHLVVVDSKTKEKISSSMFFESEGTYLQVLNGQKNSFRPLQFTGYIFKDKPPIIYGFQSNSFGCPYISFVSETSDYLWLKCDNRH